MLTQQLLTFKLLPHPLFEDDNGIKYFVPREFMYNLPVLGWLFPYPILFYVLYLKFINKQRLADAFDDIVLINQKKGYKAEEAIKFLETHDELCMFFCSTSTSLIHSFSQSHP